ncbi:hypothetical protein JG688_00005116 [Phytophthora aleatoria]|uniref:Uncharacterized protein n=1 Tax=Phytophthora aleatoria TaxID=2496075 RepID=A0A8J5IN46_9STRA|nr:hypothetical protein JG688_00005116 [Phytophthora aleatoria]
MVSKMSSESDGPRICVCDNANANRNRIEKVFGSVVTVKQDPFHVITGFIEKVADSAGFQGYFLLQSTTYSVICVLLKTVLVASGQYWKPWTQPVFQ